NQQLAGHFRDKFKGRGGRAPLRARGIWVAVGVLCQPGLALCGRSAVRRAWTPARQCLDRLQIHMMPDACHARADYTAAAVSRFRKEPVKPNETRANGESKSRKR